DCAEGNSCVDGTCRLDCDSDKDCTGGGLLCSEELGLCAECIESSDCGSGETCSQGECIAAICAPGPTQCLDNAVITGREDGRSYLEPKDCAERDGAFSDGGASCSADGSGGPRGEVILPVTCSAGSGRSGLSGGASDPNPYVRD